jgi:hypothetical protein
MATSKASPPEPNVEDIKKALVSVGVLKSTKLSKTAEAKLVAELANRGVTAAQKVIVLCRRGVYCLVIK